MTTTPNAIQEAIDQLVDEVDWLIKLLPAHGDPDYQRWRKSLPRACKTFLQRTKPRPSDRQTKRGQTVSRETSEPLNGDNRNIPR